MRAKTGVSNMPEPDIKPDPDHDDAEEKRDAPPPVQKLVAGYRAEEQHRQVRQGETARRAELRPRSDKATVCVGPRPLDRQEHRTAPFAADSKALYEAQDKHDDRAPDADLRVGWHQGHGKGRQARQQQRCDQHRPAPDPIAVVAEDERPDRPGDETDEEDRVRLHRADQRVRLRKVEFRKDQPGHGATEEKIVPLDRRSDRAGDHGAPQLPAVVDVGKGTRGNLGCRHGISPSFRRLMRHRRSGSSRRCGRDAVSMYVNTRA